MDERLFRTAMSKIATGITVVSMYDGDEPFGMTVNAFMSISLDPMLIAVSIDERASMYDKLQINQLFGISFLNEQQQHASTYFAKQSDDDTEITFINQHNAPVLQDSLATLTCSVKKRVVAGDHVICIADVKHINVDEGEPIIYFNSNYRILKDK